MALEYFTTGDPEICLPCGAGIAATSPVTARREVTATENVLILTKADALREIL